MSEHYTARLSDYLDGELPRSEAAELEAHLAGCRECADTLAELRAVVDAAGALQQLPPERDLWPGIEARLSPRSAAGADVDVVPLRRYRRVVMTVPQLVAAAIALVLFSAGAMWLTVGGTGAPGSAPTVATADAAATTVAFADFDQAIDTLEREYASHRDLLEPETIRVVERNLAIIDQAIGEARDALAADPSSGFLSSHLAKAMRQKMTLLRQAAMIAQSET